MITVRRADARSYVRRSQRELWRTFAPETEPPGIPAVDFGDLTSFDEMRLPPGGRAPPLPDAEAEVVTYLRQGTLAQMDPTGRATVIRAGEFQSMSTGRGLDRQETNASSQDWAHVFRMSVRPGQAGLPAASEQRRFPAAQRRNVLCVIAAPDGRQGALRIHQDVIVYSSLLDPGHHAIHELLPQRCAWLHVLTGAASLNDVVLSRGDAVGVATEPAVSLTALEPCEILIIDLGPAPRSFAKEVIP